MQKKTCQYSTKHGYYTIPLKLLHDPRPVLPRPPPLQAQGGEARPILAAKLLLFIRLLCDGGLLQCSGPRLGTIEEKLEEEGNLSKDWVEMIKKYKSLFYFYV